MADTTLTTVSIVRKPLRERLRHLADRITDWLMVYEECPACGRQVPESELTHTGCRRCEDC